MSIRDNLQKDPTLSVSFILWNIKSNPSAHYGAVHYYYLSCLCCALIVQLCVYLVKAENSDGYLILFIAVSFSYSVSLSNLNSTIYLHAAELGGG